MGCASETLTSSRADFCSPPCSEFGVDADEMCSCKHVCSMSLELETSPRDDQYNPGLSKWHQMLCGGNMYSGRFFIFSFIFFALRAKAIKTHSSKEQGFCFLASMLFIWYRVFASWCLLPSEVLSGYTGREEMDGRVDVTS